MHLISVSKDTIWCSTLAVDLKLLLDIDQVYLVSKQKGHFLMRTVVDLFTHKNQRECPTRLSAGNTCVDCNQSFPLMLICQFPCSCDAVAAITLL